MFEQSPHDLRLVDTRSNTPPQLFARIEADGPGAPYGFELGSFAVESEDLQLSSPELHCARTRVLDYFAAQRKQLHEGQLLFRYERSMEFGVAEEALLVLTGLPHFPSFLDAEPCEAL